MLTDAELRAFWQATERLGYPYGPLFQLLLVTGQRKSEVAEARWPEFDLAAKLWTVPPESFKSDSRHRVPLCDEALAIIETLPRFSGRNAGDLPVLDQPRAGCRSMASARPRRASTREMLAILREADPKAVLPRFVLHDLQADGADAAVVAEGADRGRRDGDRPRQEGAWPASTTSTSSRTKCGRRWRRGRARLRSIVAPPPDNVVPLERVRA